MNESNARQQVASGPLDGLTVAGRGTDPGMRHALALLRALGASVPPRAGDARLLLDATGSPDRADALPVLPRHPAADWAASGAMELTGRPDGPPLPAPGAPASAARGALLAFDALRRLGRRAPHRPPPVLAPLPDLRVLSERAALQGTVRRGPRSVGGAFRLLPTADGAFGISLSRPSDLELVPALTGEETADPWEAVESWAARTPSAEADERAALLGLPAASVGAAERYARRRGTERPCGPLVLEAIAAPAAPRAAPLVVNLSSLWAGPLCAHLLQRTGMRVVTVESTRRPDGARRGTAAFHDLLHAEDHSVALDFATAEGAETLRALLARADVVIEGSRPRALAALGIDPRQLGARRPGLSWVSITAYGRTGPWANRPGFGDDVAAAAGLVARDAAGPLPCGDALADPLTGVHAALGALAAVCGGGGWLVDIAMSEVCLAALRLGADGLPHPRDPAPAAPAVRTASGAAPALGAHTREVLAALLPPAGDGARNPAVLTDGSGA